MRPPDREFALYCTSCGQRASPDWGFCARCGAAVETLDTDETLLAERTAVSSSRSADCERALDLLSSGRELEAEALLRAAAARRDVEAQLLLADLEQRRYAFNDARTWLDEALELAPADFSVRIQRALFFARLGLNPQAREELDAARQLSAPDVASLLYRYELSRWLSDQTKHAFVRQPALPGAPRWLRSVRDRVRRSRPAQSVPTA
jgi:tetratricopeptide (TPR) repeat protein